jgi:Domain of unknown function (DUF3472)/Domain of unknown function (DUF5077)
MKNKILLTLCLSALVRVQAALDVPAFTAYLEPAEGGAEISHRGVTGWDDPAQKILWFGDIKTAGKLACAVKLELAANAETKLRLTVAGKASEVTVRGAGGATNVDFGAFEIPAAGYQSFTLESLNVAGQSAGSIESLVLDGPAAAGAHFNLEPRRNTASVHLAYPTKGVTNIDAFYCEVTPTITPLWTYFEACGWHRGYFGMQVNSPTERRIIFSVWDSGNEAVSREKVGTEDRVTLMAKGAGVYTGDFGNEGTGGHSHLVYNWKTGEKQRFLLTEKIADATHSVYSGYWFHPEQKKWLLISSWKAPKDGKYLHGLYSFVEDFGGDNGQLNRKALYGNQWYRTTDGQWHEQTVATFSHDPTGRNERFDRFMGVEAGQFFLSTGGFLPGSTKFGTPFTRPSAGQVPADVGTLAVKLETATPLQASVRP